MINTSALRSALVAAYEEGYYGALLVGEPPPLPEEVRQLAEEYADEHLPTIAPALEHE